MGVNRAPFAALRSAGACAPAEAWAMFARLGAIEDTLHLEGGLGDSVVRRLLAAGVIGLLGAATGAGRAVLWPARGGVGDLGTTAGRAEGRLALGGWAVTTLAVAGGVLAADVALAARAAQRATTMLGPPAPAASAASSPAVV